MTDDHSEDSPSAMGMNRWVELQFSRCEFVLFVCTERFMEEYRGMYARTEVCMQVTYPTDLPSAYACIACTGGRDVSPLQFTSYMSCVVTASLHVSVAKQYGCRLKCAAINTC